MEKASSDLQIFGQMNSPKPKSSEIDWSERFMEDQSEINNFKNGLDAETGPNSDHPELENEQSLDTESKGTAENAEDNQGIIAAEKPSNDQESVDEEKSQSQYFGVDGSNHVAMATEQWCRFSCPTNKYCTCAGFTILVVVVIALYLLTLYRAHNSVNKHGASLPNLPYYDM